MGHTSRKSTVLALVTASLLAALATAGPAGADELLGFNGLTVPGAGPHVAVKENEVVLRVTGTVVAGNHDPLGKNEYFLAVLSTDDPSNGKRFVLGVYAAWLDLTKPGGAMAKGEQRAISAELSLAWARRYDHRYVALAWMERDHGLGVGSIDTPLLFLTGGSPDKLGATEWLSLEDLTRAPHKVEFEPLFTGGKMSLELKVAPAGASAEAR